MARVMEVSELLIGRGKCSTEEVNLNTNFERTGE